jgi:hypothetical protein
MAMKKGESGWHHASSMLGHRLGHELTRGTTHFLDVDVYILHMDIVIHIIYNYIYIYIYIYVFIYLFIHIFIYLKK